MKKPTISNIIRSAFITGSIITVLIISQLNWACDHEYYEDIVLRIVFSIVLGIILGAFYLWLLYTNLRFIINIINKIIEIQPTNSYLRFSSLDYPRKLKRISIIHAPLYLLWFYVFHITIPYAGSLNSWLKIIVPVSVLIFIIRFYYGITIEKINSFFSLRDINYEIGPLSLQFILVGATFLMLFFFILFISSCLFLIGLSIYRWVFPVALVAAFISLWLVIIQYEKEHRVKRFIKISAIVLLLLISSVLISSQFYHFGLDSQWYHSDMMVLMYNGWNPFYDILREGSFDFVQGTEYYDVILHCNSKGSELLGAVLFKFINNYEGSKAFQIIFMITAFCLASSALLSFKFIPSKISILLALLIALNPVAIMLTFSLNVDGQLASIILIIISLSFLIFSYRDNLFLSLLAASLAVGITLKLTAVVYCVVIAFATVITFFIFNKTIIKLKTFFFISAGLIIGFALFGFNPYITNTLNYRSPFYPFLGTKNFTFNELRDKGNFLYKSLDEIMSENVKDRHLENQNSEKAEDPLSKGKFYKAQLPNINNISYRLKNLFITTFSESSGLPVSPQKLKLPFTISKGELYYLKGSYPLVNSGFGPLFSGILLLTGLIMFFSFSISERKTLISVIMFVMILSSVLVTSAAFIPRYAPQLWLIVFCTIPLGFCIDRKIIRYITFLMIFLLCNNVSFFLFKHYPGQYYASRGYNLKHEFLKESSKPVKIFFYPRFRLTHKKRFKDMGINYV